LRLDQVGKLADAPKRQGMQPEIQSTGQNRGIILGAKAAWQDVCLMLCCENLVFGRDRPKS